MQITNQKPVMISPVYHSKISGDFKPQEYVKETLATPLFNPLVANQPVTMTSNNSPITEDDIVYYITDCCGATVNATAEAAVKEIFSKTLVYFDKNAPLSVQNAFSIQAAVKEKMPFPTSTCVYTPATDVIPVSKEFLAGQCDYEKYFATLAFYARPYTLGFYFANSVAFDNFKTWLNNQIQSIASVLTAETNQLFNDFQQLSLNGLTESLVLRNADDENNQEYSFARTLISYMMLYTNNISSAEYGVLPFEINELYCPRTVVFVNVERHSNATSKQVADEWNIINSSLNMKIKITSNSKISKLTAAARNIQKIKGAAANAVSNACMSNVRAARARFRKTAPTAFDITKTIIKLINKMASVAKSENIYKSVKMTFAKPNRRNPDDFNKQGKMVSVKYKPDIHIYLDTSGSISELNYQDAIKSCIKLAKKLNINLYFNSFSHSLSQCTKLNTKDKSTKAIYAEFQKIPKVSGGTDYEQIWHYINQSAKRRRELSLIISDFEWSAPNHFVKHPKNLYYAPISNANWNYITDSAAYFCSSMVNIDPDCRKHIIF